MRSLGWLNHYLWRYKGLMLGGLGAAIAAAVFQLVVPGLVREAVDAIPRMVDVYEQFGGTPAADAYYSGFLWTLAGIAVAIVIASVTSGLFSFTMRRTVVVASRHIEYDLRNRLYAHLQRLGPAFYQQYPTGDIITRATSDVERIRRYIGPAIMYATRAITTVIAALVVMLAISPTLTLWALLPMPILAVAIFFVSRLVHVRTDRQQAQYSALTTRVQEALAGIRVVKAYAREGFEADRFAAESDRYKERTLDLVKVDAAFRPIMRVLIGASTILVVWVGGRLVAEGVVTIGNIAEYVIYVAILTWPVASFGYVISMMQQAAASAARIKTILDWEPAVYDGDQTDASLKTVRGALAFEDVSFRYGDGPEVLKDVSFSLPAGRTLGIVGRTGSGKSTLVEMIPRLVEPTAGRVLVDGRDVRDIPLDVLRAHVGYVPQEVFLFSDTVGGNIAFGELGADEADIRRAAEEADLLGNVEDFPSGFETVVGERGITLSGGQKQRAAIARGLIREPAILVLDDALSAVDTRTESTILGHLRRHYGRRTVVVVSHRISAVQDADLILVLDDGAVSERGTHAELVAQDGAYAALYRKQLLEQELAEA